jgi:hypothetical protein
MRLDEIFELTEVKGSGSFDYKYWFWAKKGPTYGLGYARQDIKVDIQDKGKQAADAIDNISNVLDTLDKNDLDNLEVVETKVKANTKRIKGIVDLFRSPIVIHWLNNDPPKVVEIPKTKDGDVTVSGKQLDVVELFDDAKTSEFLKTVMDWSKVKINDEVDTLNTVTAKFIRDLFTKEAKQSELRKIARTAGLEEVMTDLHFTNYNIEVKSFNDSDYDLLPQELLGSKKIVSKLKEIIDNKFAEVLKIARKRI